MDLRSVLLKNLLTPSTQFSQAVLADKEEGLQHLNLAIEQGERLYPDTAVSGREKIRKQLRTAKDVWDGLVTDMTAAQRKLDMAILAWSTYKGGVEQLEKWFLDVETQLRTDDEDKNTLAEKRAQLQHSRATLQDVQSHGRVVDGVVEKAQTLLQMSHSADVERFIQETMTRYQNIADLAKVGMVYCMGEVCC